ncbi:MAG: anhydro-N-acetylmuramic acid kinase [Longimicrobiales bacterium]
MRVIGLMSGTSLDGIDAALIEIDGDATAVRWSLTAFHETPYTDAQREAIHDAISTGTAERLCRINVELGEWHAHAAASVAEHAGVSLDDIAAIGSHGQTVWHIPPSQGARGATLQLGCAATIAERTGVSVVSDFRSRDVAAGGQGAPLVPWADQLLFAHDTHARVLVNIGGMANLTWVPPRGVSNDVLAFDTGPGNALVDAAVGIATNGAHHYDDNGDVARAGVVDERLLDTLLANPFFAMAPPRSTGRELFGRSFVQELIGQRGGDPATAARSLIRTLTELTARSIAGALDRFVRVRGAGEVIVTGGGARNGYLMERLAQLLAPMSVIAGEAAGINAAAKEAIVFAALAWAHIHRVPGNLPTATGASGPRVLGSFTPGSRDPQL